VQPIHCCLPDPIINLQPGRKRHLRHCVPADSGLIPDLSTGEATQELRLEQSRGLTSGADICSDLTGTLLHPCGDKRHEAFVFLRRALLRYSLNTPRPSDLPMLSRLNVLHALGRNALILEIPFHELYRPDTISSFHIPDPVRQGEVASPQPCAPDPLTPTSLQRSMPHHPWIDLLPFPGMRDNILRSLCEGWLNEDQLCEDLLKPVEDCTNKQGPLVVWGDSWDPQNWEISDDFIRKWAVLIQGCPEVIEVSNRWREKRGQMKLEFV
jgi:hypothetical protein